MYLNHFGLQEAPFGLTPNTGFYYGLPPHEEALQVLNWALDRRVDAAGNSIDYSYVNDTANGEQFRPGWITAAHTTLPLPTYVEVTALDTGRRIIVRVNDRGPFAQGRIIDLSRGAAEQLGIKAQGHAAVRVRRVEPSEKDRERLRKGKPAASLERVSDRELQRLRARMAPAAR